MSEALPLIAASQLLITAVYPAATLTFPSRIICFRLFISFFSSKSIPSSSCQSTDTGGQSVTKYQTCHGAVQGEQHLPGVYTSGSPQSTSLNTQQHKNAARMYNNRPNLGKITRTTPHVHTAKCFHSNNEQQLLVMCSRAKLHSQSHTLGCDEPPSCPSSPVL